MNASRQPDMDNPHLGELGGTESVAADAVLDKKAWHQAVEETVAQANQDDSQVAVIFIDVNHFKDVNDTLGHLAGDEVIASIRQILANSIRITSDRPAEERDRISVSKAKDPAPTRLRSAEFQAGHIGGDEFGILCKTDEKGALALVERLRRVFNDYVTTSEDKGIKNLDISLAIGVSVLQPGMNSSDLLHLADQGMYDDKIRQLAPLNEEQRAFLNSFAEGLDQHQIRLRDVGKYLTMLAEQS